MSNRSANDETLGAMSAPTNDTATVLVIDDDRVIRMVVREALSGVGFHVEEADDAASGIRRAVELKPTLIILDVMLPRVDGLELLSEFRAQGVMSPVLVFSATGSKNKDRAFQLGAADYMSKPFELHELITRVQNILYGPSVQAEAV